MDPLQAMLEQTANTASMFAENSRYRNMQTLSMRSTDGRTIAYLQRRLLPAPESMATLAIHTLSACDRLDHLAHRYLGDPELFWQLCDANRVLRPEELTDTHNEARTINIIRIGLPPGVPGVNS